MKVAGSERRAPLETPLTASALLDCPALEAAVVRLVLELRHEQLDEAAHAGLRRLLRDQLALQVGISQLPWSRQVLAYARAQGTPGPSTVAAGDVRLHPADAAFVNASYGHGFEYDDAHGPSNSHPGSCVIPAAFAIGEALDAKLGDVLIALVAGYEVYARIGALLAPELLRRGFHPHAVLSAFGAAAVAARLYRFDAETTLHALSIAASHAAGTTEYTSTGGSIKRVHAGIGTRNGIAAAEMARAGLTGPRAFLGGAKGLFRTFVQRAPAADAAQHFGLDRPFEVGEVWLKAYCACYCTHAYIDAVRPWAARLADISGVLARITPSFNVVVGTANAHAYAPRNIEHLQYSLPAQMALALLDHGNGYRVHRDYLEGRVDMDPVLALARTVRIEESPELDQRYPGRFVADVTMQLRDGTTSHVFVEDPVGTTARPMTEAEQQAKFRELTIDVLGVARAEALLSAVQAVDPAMPVRALMALTTTGAAR